MNVVTQLTQFVGRDVINKNTTDLLRAVWLYAVQLGQLSWVELCRYKRAFSFCSEEWTILNNILINVLGTVVML